MKCDSLGNEFKVGDLLAYGTRDGNVGVLHLGLLTNLDQPQVRVFRQEDGKWVRGSYGNMKNLNSSIKIEKSFIKDIGLLQLLQKPNE